MQPGPMGRDKGGQKAAEMTAKEQAQGRRGRARGHVGRPQPPPGGCPLAGNSSLSFCPVSCTVADRTMTRSFQAHDPGPPGADTVHCSAGWTTASVSPR